MSASQVSTTIDRTNLMKTLHKELLEELHSRIAIRIEDIDDIIYGDEMYEYGEPKDIMIEEYNYYHDMLNEIDFQLYIKYSKI